MRVVRLGSVDHGAISFQALEPHGGVYPAICHHEVDPGSEVEPGPAYLNRGGSHRRFYQSVPQGIPVLWWEAHTRMEQNRPDSDDLRLPWTRLFIGREMRLWATEAPSPRASGATWTNRATPFLRIMLAEPKEFRLPLIVT